MDLKGRYLQIHQRFSALKDFELESLAQSRELFNLDANPVTPRSFEVWTSLAGLPLPQPLTSRFQRIVSNVEAILPAGTRFYKVPPANYHWELFIIKRPNEIVAADQLLQVAKLLQSGLRQQPSFTLSYQGFLITVDGTVIVSGYGEFDSLRQQLRQQIPFASKRQSELGHISLGRILDPVGQSCFIQLKQLVEESQNQFYGEFKIDQVKYVHERQWYMEAWELVAELRLQD
ncbi:hypothetical protein [Leptolyngbya sp. FACHB-261]|uniref:hypothetical protein n=1 Tax=Leptolyngbya sp. FACHB-261 TaxID=2692806 RepID=UPI001686EB65|nr:hypothetical protein [Leptolyngbya sp. FACHB-261]MBD2100074.1 hypothetical protein [Leptolyngbya sp. FACHB-261]